MAILRRAPASSPKRLALCLISRVYCHLCQEMEAALRPLADSFGFSVEIIDVDAHENLLAQYDESVPVLRHGEIELCRRVLEAAKVRDYLAKIR